MKHSSCKSLDFWWSLFSLLLLLSSITPALAVAFPSVDSAQLFYVAIGKLSWQILLEKLISGHFLVLQYKTKFSKLVLKLYKES